MTFVNGWEMSSIFRVNDGVPFTPTFGSSGGDPQGMLGTDPWAFPDRIESDRGAQEAVNPGIPTIISIHRAFTSDCAKHGILAG